MLVNARVTRVTAPGPDDIAASTICLKQVLDCKELRCTVLSLVT